MLVRLISFKFAGEDIPSRKTPQNGRLGVFKQNAMKLLRSRKIILTKMKNIGARGEKQRRKGQKRIEKKKKRRLSAQDIAQDKGTKEGYQDTFFPFPFFVLFGFFPVGTYLSTVPLFLSFLSNSFLFAFSFLFFLYLFILAIFC